MDDFYKAAGFVLAVRDGSPGVVVIACGCSVVTHNIIPGGSAVYRIEYVHRAYCAVRSPVDVFAGVVYIEHPCRRGDVYCADDSKGRRFVIDID